MALQTPATQVKQPGIKTVADEEWWVHEDAPVRVAETVVPLADGRSALLAMCAAFLTAKKRIWLADWSLTAQMRLVRGKDQRAGPDGSPEQYALIDRLRAAGLDREAIALWESGGLRLVDVLRFAARRGVDVRVLLWGPFNPGGLFHLVNNPEQQLRILQGAGVQCRLDKSTRSPFHVAQALHQKCAVVDSALAFVGGIDPTIDYGGDFDRWDTHAHLFQDPLRRTQAGPVAHPWHDAHLLLTGDPTRDVERNIRQRWDEAALGWWHKVTPPLKHLAKFYLGLWRDIEEAGRPQENTPPPQGAGPQLGGQPARVQVVRTIPALTYRFAPAGIHGIVESYRRAIRQARQFIYLESQYLWLEGFPGINSPSLGWESRYMRALLSDMAEALERGVRLALVLPDHPNVGRAFTDKTIHWLRRHAPQATAEGRLHFFTLASCEQRNGFTHYRPIYVHAKVGMVDDCWTTVGSANLNSRGMSHDAEMNLSLLDREFARALRLTLWAEHTGALSHAQDGWPAPAILPVHPELVGKQARGLMTLVRPHHALQPQGARAHSSPSGGTADTSGLEAPEAGIALMVRCAQENLTRLRQGKPLIGHLLPYLRHQEGKELGLQIDAEQGLLDPLRSVREGVKVRHPGRYT